MSWRDSAIPVDQPKSWRDSAIRVGQASPQEFSLPQAIIRKYGEGLSGGLTNVLAAGGESLINGTPYKEELKKIGQESEQISKQHPYLSPIAEIGGLVTPGGLFNKATQGATNLFKATGAVRPALSGIAGTLLGTGAYEAADKTTKVVEGAKTPSDAADDILHNLSLQTGISLISPALSKAGGLAGTAVRWGRNKLLSGPGLSQESIEIFAKEPKEVYSVMREKLENYLPQYAERFNDTIKTFVKDRLSQLNDALKPHEAIQLDIRPVMDAGNKVIADLKAFESTPLKTQAISKINGQLEYLQKLGVPGPQGEIFIPAPKVLNLKRDLGELSEKFYEEAGFKKDAASAAIASMERTADGMLDKLSPDIQRINNELSTVINGQKALGVGNVFKKSGKMDPQQARRILSTLTNPSKAGIVQDIQAMDEVAGTDIYKASQLFKAAQEVGNPDAFSRSSTGRSMLKSFLLTKPLGWAMESPMMQRNLLIPGSEGLANMLESPPGKEVLKKGLYGAIRK